MIRLAGTGVAKGGRRLSALQALIVFAVVGLVAALAIPALATQAKTSVLGQNQDALALQVRTQVALGPDATFATYASLPTDDSNAAALSAALSEDLRSGAAGRFVNPVSGSAAIVSGAPPASGSAAQPAVWITDDPHYAYAAFRPTEVTSSGLAGTLVVAFAGKGDGTSIDVYYVDARGRRSPSVDTISASAAAQE